MIFRPLRTICAGKNTMACRKRQLASTAKVTDLEVQIVPKVVSISMMQKGCSFSDLRHGIGYARVSTKTTIGLAVDPALSNSH
jgi:hypothetical protein